MIIKPEHLKIIRALEQHDADAAHAAMSAHLSVAVQLILKEMA